MGRTANLLGRVRHNLVINGIKTGVIEDDDIYDALSKIQDKIIAEKKCLDREVLLPLVISTTDYSLTGLKDSANNTIPIATIKGIIRPGTWEYMPEFVSARDWDTVLNDQRNSYYPSYYISSNQPLWFTVFENEIKFYPAPAAVETVKLLAILSCSYLAISIGVDPIIQQYFDRALELGATADLLPIEMQALFIQKFEDSILKAGSIPFRTTTYTRQNKQWW